jgi:AraC-like DNA-binding protein
MKKQSDSIKTFNLPFISGIEVIFGEHIINEFRRHIHKTYIIGIVEEGQRVITHSKGSVKILEKEVFVLNPNQVHSCSSENPGHSYKILSVSSKTMQSIASYISEMQEKRPYFKKIHYESGLLSNKMIRLFEVIAEPEFHIQIESALYSFLTYLIMRFSESPPLICALGEQKDSIKRVCDYIQHSFAENLSLKKLAEIACLSPFHFQREFKKRVGVTPHEYLSDFKIYQSKKMLLNSEDIADIAAQLGFFDQSHFSRIFKKTVGISPGKYAKINKMY